MTNQEMMEWLLVLMAIGHFFLIPYLVYTKSLLSQWKNECFELKDRKEYYWTCYEKAVKLYIKTKKELEKTKALAKDGMEITRELCKDDSAIDAALDLAEKKEDTVTST